MEMLAFCKWRRALRAGAAKSAARVPAGAPLEVGLKTDETARPKQVSDLLLA